MSIESFNPGSPEYREVKDLPQEHQAEFANVEGGFVQKSALETQERLEKEAKEMDDLRGGIKKLFSVGKVEPEDIMRKEASIEDGVRKRAKETGKNEAYVQDETRQIIRDEKLLSSLSTKELAKEVEDDRLRGFSNSRDYHRIDIMKDEIGKRKLRPVAKVLSFLSSLVPGNDDVKKGLEQAKKRNPFF